MNRKRLILLLSCLALIAIAALASVRPVRRGYWPRRTVAQRTLESAKVTETVSRSMVGRLTRSERTYNMDNGDLVVFGRMQAGDRQSMYHLVRTDVLDSRTGTVWYMDNDTKDWKTVPLEEMKIGTTCVYIDGDQQDYFCYTPYGYLPLENNCLQENGSKGYLTIVRSGSKWKLMLFGAALQPTEVCDYTVLTASDEEPLLDTERPNLMKLWSTYANNGDGRWCYDGYYFPTPGNYIPTGPFCRYRCVASYLVSSMVAQEKGVRFGRDIAEAMLDTVSLQQNAQGYFPTLSESAWLREDYGIPGGFYDTRFNSDLMQAFYRHVSLRGGFSQTLDRYFEFYLDYAAKSHYETENGGWLVWDYNNSTSPVHVSLNHHVSEMLILYQFGNLLDRQDLTQLADRMLLGIEDTEDSWIKEDGNFCYARYPDGSFGGNDYPYLTYNDLYDLQKGLISFGYPRNKTIDRLMESKLRWMQENGITGYHTDPLE